MISKNNEKGGMIKISHVVHFIVRFLFMEGAINHPIIELKLPPHKDRDVFWNFGSGIFEKGLDLSD